MDLVTNNTLGHLATDHEKKHSHSLPWVRVWVLKCSYHLLNSNWLRQSEATEECFNSVEGSEFPFECLSKCPHDVLFTSWLLVIQVSNGFNLLFDCIFLVDSTEISSAQLSCLRSRNDIESPSVEQLLPPSRTFVDSLSLENGVLFLHWFSRLVFSAVVGSFLRSCSFLDFFDISLGFLSSG